MGKRAAVAGLPEPVRRQLHAKLVDSGFAGYDALVEWLQSLGYEISRSAVHRYGQTFEERLHLVRVSSEQARAVVEAAPDLEGAMSDALIRLVQDRLFTVLVEINQDPKTIKDLPKIARAVADLSRSTVNLRKYQTEVRKRADDAAKAVEAIGKTGGITPELIARIQQEIYGIAP